MLLRKHPKPLHSESTMVRVDKEEFFMSGSPKELTEGISTMFDDKNLGRFVEDAAKRLLSIYMVQCDDIYGQWLLVRGSGKGLPHSGALVDCAFWLRAEQNFVNNTKIVGERGMLMYTRLKDDAFFLVNDGTIAPSGA